MPIVHNLFCLYIFCCCLTVSLALKEPVDLTLYPSFVKKKNTVLCFLWKAGCLTAKCVKYIIPSPPTCQPTISSSAGLKLDCEEYIKIQFHLADKCQEVTYFASQQVPRSDASLLSFPGRSVNRTLGQFQMCLYTFFLCVDPHHCSYVLSIHYTIWSWINPKSAGKIRLKSLSSRNRWKKVTSYVI